VYATVDPWLYNEYTDGRKLPPEYDNYAAGKEFVRWILEQVPRERPVAPHVAVKHEGGAVR
jgi:unsaturated rhamnogalacturonyl hydrolase